MLREKGYDEALFNHLKIDCSKCFGLCCVALFFSKCDGFPTDKGAGKPCLNLKVVPRMTVLEQVRRWRNLIMKV